jgi:hypothetical protein
MPIIEDHAIVVMVKEEEDKEVAEALAVTRPKAKVV